MVSYSSFDRSGHWRVIKYLGFIKLYVCLRFTQVGTMPYATTDDTLVAMLLSTVILLKRFIINV